MNNIRRISIAAVAVAALIGGTVLSHFGMLNDFTITTQTEVQTPEPMLTDETENGAKKVNLNTADAAELTKLNGIGEKLAQRIITYRAEHGLFDTAEEIMKVSGIGQKKFEAIKEEITVE